MYIFGWSLLLNFLFILHCNIYIYGVNQKFYEEQHKNSIDLRTKFFKIVYQLSECKHPATLTWILFCVLLGYIIFNNSVNKYQQSNLVEVFW